LASPGKIEVHAETVSLTDRALIAGGSPLTIGTGGIVTIDADLVSIAGESRISSQAFGRDAGRVTITAGQLTLDNGSIVTSTASNVFGSGGNVEVNGGVVSLVNGSTINSSTSGTGRAGDIIITTEQSVTVDSGSNITANTVGQGNAGNVLLGSAGTITVTNGSEVSTSAQPPEVFFGLPNDLTGTAGNIAIVTGNSLVISNGGTIASASQTGGNAGTISIFTPSSALDNGTITTSTSSTGNAGGITANAGTLTLTNAAEISSSSTGTASGNAGSITIQGLVSAANSVTITDSSLLTSAADTGQGGSVTVSATNLALNNATVSASVNNFDTSAGSTDGATIGLGNIDLTASTMTVTGSTVTTESSGARNAGDIKINPDVAGNSFQMQNSTINTSASLSDGGNIVINVSDMFRMTNSVVTSSVGNPQKTDTKGGNIAIDPQFVVLQNSQVIAQAFAGAGGAITITAASAFIADPASIVSASSTKGISGTVNIQSPLQNVGAELTALTQEFSSAAALLAQQCAARAADGKFSTFVIAAREGLPAEPGGFLASPSLTAELLGSRDSGGQTSHSQLSAITGLFPQYDARPIQLAKLGDACHR
jgi:large exoprotein involved in heme utilization and adhesion